MLSHEIGDNNEFGNLYYLNFCYNAYFGNAALYALFASQLREAIRKTSVRKWFNRCGDTALIGAGIFTAGMQRSA